LFLACLEGLVAAAVLALTALGLSLVFGVMRIVNIAHGEFYMLGAVFALVVSPLMVGAIALLAERLILRRLSYEPKATIVATIGLLYILQQLTLTFYGPDARAVTAPFSWRVDFPWFGYSGYKLFVVAAAALLVLASWLIINRTKLGLIMRAAQFD